MKVAKWLVAAVALPLSLGLVVVLVSVAFFVRESMLGRGDAVNADERLGPAAAAKVAEATTTLRETGTHRAFTAPGRGRITNYHVVASLCPERNCSGGFDGLVVARCSRWLDVCALREKGVTDELGSAFEVADAAVGDEIVLADKEERERKVRIGRVTGVSAGYGTADLYVAKGYSGSPLFDVRGRVVGIVHSAAPKAVVSRSIVKALGLDTTGSHYATAMFTPASTVRDVLLCAKSESECVVDELAVFLAYFAHWGRMGQAAFGIDPNLVTNVGRFWGDFYTRLDAAPPTEDIDLLKKLRHLARAANFEQSVPLAMEPRLADPKWYRAFVAMAIADVMTGSYREDYGQMAEVLRKPLFTPDDEFRAVAANFIETF